MAGIDGEMLAPPVIGGHDRTRLHGAGGNAVHDETVLHHHVGGGKGLLGGLPVALGGVEGLVVRALVPDRRGAGQVGGGRVELDGQGLVVDLDGLAGILGLGNGFGDHHGDRLAHMAHPVAGQGRAGRAEHRRAITLLGRRSALHVAELLLGIVFAGQDGDDAGHLRGHGGVDPQEFGVGMRRAQEDRIALPVHEDVIGEAALTLQETRCFHLTNRLTD